jgi:hypothetical protein
MGGQMRLDVETAHRVDLPVDESDEIVVCDRIHHR